MIVDFEAMEKPIKEIEKVLGQYNLTEKELILNQVNARIQKSKRKAQSQDLLEDMNMPSLMKGIFRKMQKDETEDN